MRWLGCLGAVHPVYWRNLKHVIGVVMVEQTKLTLRSREIDVLHHETSEYACVKKQSE